MIFRVNVCNEEHWGWRPTDIGFRSRDGLRKVGKGTILAIYRPHSGELILLPDAPDERIVENIWARMHITALLKDEISRFVPEVETLLFFDSRDVPDPRDLW